MIAALSVPPHARGAKSRLEQPQVQPFSSTYSIISTSGSPAAISGVWAFPGQVDSFGMPRNSGANGFYDQLN